LTLNRETIKQILAVLSIPDRQTDSHTTSRCDLYSGEDCERYLDGQMDEETIRSFEDHCVNCFSCLEQLYFSDVESAPEQEKQENEQLFQKTRERLAQLEDQNHSTLLDVVIRVTGKIVELLSTTGVSLQTAQPVSVRGSEPAHQDVVPPLRIMYDIPDSAYSLQINFYSEAGGVVTVKLSVFNRDNEEFAAGITVHLKTLTTESTQVSDENGEVSFTETGKGKHVLTLSDNEKVLGTIALTIM